MSIVYVYCLEEQIVCQMCLLFETVWSGSRRPDTHFLEEVQAPRGVIPHGREVWAVEFSKLFNEITQYSRHSIFSACYAP